MYSGECERAVAPFCYWVRIYISLGTFDSVGWLKIDKAQLSMLTIVCQSVSTMSNFFLAMVKYPDVQDKAQAELDTTLEHGRLPTFEDRDSLPYLSALVKELLRWAPAAPLAIAHTSNKDDMYRGYTFPSGTILMPNTWSGSSQNFQTACIDHEI